MRRLLLIASIAVIALTVVATPRTSSVKNTAAASDATVQEKATVKISNFQFTPKSLTIAPGTTVEWANEAGRHLVVADDGSFKSDTSKQGEKFEHKFDKAGRFPYHCEFHGEKGGKDMAGTIVVRGQAKK